MKIGTTTGRIRLWGDQGFKKAKELGYSCVDIGFENTELPVYFCDESEIKNFVGKDKRLVQEAGLEISQIHGPWRFPPQDYTKEDRAERLEKMKRCVQIAAEIGAKHMVIHPVMPFGLEDRGTEYAVQTWEINRKFMGELLETAKEYDVIICLENMPFPNFSMSKPEEILRFVQEMNDEHFKICLDTGHAAIFKDVSIGDAARMLGKELRVTHIHDNKGVDDLHLIPFCGGISDWLDFGNALMEIGYEGVFSYESAISTNVPVDILEDIMALQIKLAKRIIGE